MEVLRLGKQMSVGRNFGPTYRQLHTMLVAESGLIGAMYRVFPPWGLIQCSKGVPVLFMQHEAMYQLTYGYTHWCSPQAAETISGFMGVMAQAIFICPLQKVKIAVVATQDFNSMTASQAYLNIMMRQGGFSLFDGLVPMMLWRSLDWGIWLGASSEIKNMVLASKRAHGDKSRLNAVN